MTTENTQHANSLSDTAADLATQLRTLSDQAAEVAVQVSAGISGHEAGFFLNGLTVFLLACFVGYYVVWRVTPALHSPLMGVTNAISSVIIVGALLAAGTDLMGFSKFMGFLAVILASINIFGGFIVTKRMLHMFSKKKA